MSISTRLENFGESLPVSNKEAALGMGLVFPAIAIIVVALIYPFLNAILLSFYNISANTFVGLDHYAWIVNQSSALDALWRSILWTVSNLALQGLVGIGLALLLHQQFFGRGFVRTILLIPFVIPTAVTAIMWSWMLNMSYGPVNHWLVQFGLLSQPFNPLTSPSTALLGVVLINTWRWAPLVALVVFAVLQTIPVEEYEAARIEGAGLLQEFWHVTYPHLSKSMTVLGLLGTLLTFNIFDMLWLLTQGGPIDATSTLPVLIYETAFNAHEIGRSTAISVVLFLFLAVFVVLYFQQEELKEGGFA